MRVASGLGRLRILVPLSLIFLLQPLLAEGQETPTGPAAPPPPIPGVPPTTPQEVPTVPRPVAPPGPTGLPLTIPPGYSPSIVPGSPPTTTPEGEAIGPLGPGGPLRTLPFAPPLAEAVGPFSIQTSLSVEEEFTDNADQTKENRRSEFRTNITPSLAVGINRPESTLNLVYVPRVVIFNDHPSDTTVEHDLTLRGAWTPTAQLRLGLAEDFTKSKDFTSVGNIGTRLTGQTPFTRNSVAVDSGYASPRGLQAGLSYSNDYEKNEGFGGDTSRTNTAQASLGFNGPRIGLSSSYALTRGEFDIASPYWAYNALAKATRAITPNLDGALTATFTYHDADRDQDFFIYGAILGGTARFASGGSLSVYVGPQVFAPKGDPVKVRPSGSISWNQPFNFFSLTAGYSAGYQQEFGAISNTGVTFEQSASISLVSNAIRNLTASLGVGWVENRFEQATITTGAPGTVDQTWNVDVGLRYNLIRWLSLTMGYTFTIRTSTQASAEFYENRVRLGLTAQYNPF